MNAVKQVNRIEEQTPPKKNAKQERITIDFVPKEILFSFVDSNSCENERQYCHSIG
jgi:hypothetical protein